MGNGFVAGCDYGLVPGIQKVPQTEFIAFLLAAAAYMDCNLLAENMAKATVAPGAG